MIYRSNEQLKEVDIHFSQKVENQTEHFLRSLLLQNVIIELKISFFRILRHIRKRETGL